MEEKTADKVFVFHVALADGVNIVTAGAGKISDSMTLEKVDAEPSVYALPEAKERAEGVANWFKLAGNLDLKAPMEFPEGRYSIRDTIEELADSQEAWDITAEAFRLAANMKLARREGMWDMIKSVTLEDALKMAGSMVPEGFTESVNAKLIKIEK